MVEQNVATLESIKRSLSKQITSWKITKENVSNKHKRNFGGKWQTCIKLLFPPFCCLSNPLISLYYWIPFHGSGLTCLHVHVVFAFGPWEPAKKNKSTLQNRNQDPDISFIHNLLSSGTCLAWSSEANLRIKNILTDSFSSELKH